MKKSRVRVQSNFSPVIEARVRKFKIGEEQEEEITAEERWKTIEAIRRSAWQFKTKGKSEPKFYRTVRKIYRSQG